MLRGNHSDVPRCMSEAKRIVTEVDSKFQVKIAPVGAWLPITDDDAVVQNVEEVSTDEKDKAYKDAQKKTLEDNDGDIYDNPNSLDFYTMKRVTEMKLFEAEANMKNKLKEIQDKICESQKELFRIESQSPEYIDQWIDRYNVERKKAGIPDFIPSEIDVERHIIAMKTLSN